MISAVHVWFVVELKHWSYGVIPLLVLAGSDVEAGEKGGVFIVAHRWKGKVERVLRLVTV